MCNGPGLYKQDIPVGLLTCTDNSSAADHRA